MKKKGCIALYYFLFFILGFVVAQYLIPLLESVWAIVLTWLEIPKGKCALKVQEINQKINNLADDCGEASHAIGFVYNQADDDYQEEEDE